MNKGSLTVVGWGMTVSGQCSIETQNVIAAGEVVLSVMGDALMQQALERLNPNAISLQHFYESEPNRPAAYHAMVEKILAAVRSGARVVLVIYGHAGVFVWPSHEAVRRARQEGFDAQMLPAISAEDCLIADLGVDPAQGWQTYEARDFFLHARAFDPSAALILWQIAVISDDTFTVFNSNARAMGALAEVLMETYSPDHHVTVYEAATLPTAKAKIQRVTLCDLARAQISQASTLYVPPDRAPQVSPQRAALMQAYLGGAR